MAKLKSNLNKILQDKEISVNKLAAELNATRSTITALTNEDVSGNRIPGELVAKICDYLNVPINELLEVIKDDDFELYRDVFDYIRNNAVEIGHEYFMWNDMPFEIYKEINIVSAFSYSDRWDWRIRVFFTDEIVFMDKSINKCLDWLKKTSEPGDIRKVELKDLKEIHNNRHIFHYLQLEDLLLNHDYVYIVVDNKFKIFIKDRKLINEKFLSIKDKSYKWIVKVYDESNEETTIYLYSVENVLRWFRKNFEGYTDVQMLLISEK